MHYETLNKSGNSDLAQFMFNTFFFTFIKEIYFRCSNIEQEAKTFKNNTIGMFFL